MGEFDWPKVGEFEVAIGALVLNQLHHDFGVHASLDLPTATLIVGLATQAHELASPAYAEP